MQDHLHQANNDATTIIHNKFKDIIKSSVHSVCELLDELPHKRLEYLKLCIRPNEEFNYVINELNKIYKEETKDEGTSQLVYKLTTLREFFLEDKGLHITY